jgi:SET domain-containing protein
VASRLPFLYLQISSLKGRAIYTAQPIPEGSSIESCPVIVLSAADTKRIHQTHLHDYYFLWGEEGRSAIALGFGSIYNHAADPNTDYEMDIDNQSIDFFALRDIEAGEEITISYTEGGLQRTKLWFEVK